MEYCEVSSTYMVKFHKVDKKVKRHWFYMCVCVCILFDDKIF